VAYPNLTSACGTVLSSGKASMTELGSSLGVEDLYLLVELVMVDAHNFRVLNPDRD
jgi:hypothetical protein